MDTQVVNELLGLLTKLQAERETLRREWDKRLAEHNAKIAAVETTLKLYSNGAKIPEVETSTIEVGTLQGLGWKSALCKIAESNNGLVRLTEAKRLLIHAGVAKGNPKYILPRLYNMMAESEEWERVEPGIFRLLAEPHQASLSVFE